MNTDRNHGGMAVQGVDKNTAIRDGLGPLDRGNADIIIGAGPAGLTAALEDLTGEPKHPVVVLEQGEQVGGISRTVEHHGNRMDIGGHRFFTRIPQIRNFWLKLMPVQGRPAFDEVLMGTAKKKYPGTPFANPEKFDRVMLIRRRISRIFFGGRFFDYPVSLSFSTIWNLGFFRLICASFSFLFARIFPRKVRSLEDYYVNSFGWYLYHLFFEDYTCKVWGKHPSELDADWGKQRVKGMSLWTMLLHFLRSLFGIRKQDKASLISEFLYPKYGPGSLWEEAALGVHRMSGEIYTSSKVTELNIVGKRVVSVRVRASGGETVFSCRNCFSSMPIPELVGAMRGIIVPDEIRAIVSGLEFRDFITVGVLLKDLKIRNRTAIASWNSRIPDTWIYVQDRSVRMGRIQVFNNWSPYMVQDYKKTVWLGLEYFCREGDELWNMSDEDFIRKAVSELETMGIASSGDVLDSVRIRVPKAYPSYTGTYGRMEELRKWLDSFENLFCIGRNGQHRYNNMDHSMMTGLLAVHAAESGKPEHRQAVWNVNTDDEYCEEEKKAEDPGGQTGDPLEKTSRVQ